MHGAVLLVLLTTAQYPLDRGGKLGNKETEKTMRKNKRKKNMQTKNPAASGRVSDQFHGLTAMNGKFSDLAQTISWCLPFRRGVCRRRADMILYRPKKAAAEKTAAEAKQVRMRTCAVAVWPGCMLKRVPTSGCMRQLVTRCPVRFHAR